jgi:hypothetical protein
LIFEKQTTTIDVLAEEGPVLQAKFHRVKKKLMDRERRAGQEPGVVIQWFKEYADVRKIHWIGPENTRNFDGSGF